MILPALGRGLLEAVFPPSCAACDAPGREPFCRVCEEALVAAGRFELEGAESALAVFEYGGPVADAVQAFKYGGRWTAGRPLGGVMAEHLGADAIDWVVPVPLSRPRLVERGYNQARELARGIPHPVRARALVRAPGVPQVGLAAAARRANLVQAIRPGPESVEGARVLLVDDVVTTQATAEACVQALREAGAKSVRFVALARTAREGPGPT